MKKLKKGLILVCFMMVSCMFFGNTAQAEEMISLMDSTIFPDNKLRNELCDWYSYFLEDDDARDYEITSEQADKYMLYPSSVKRLVIGDLSADEAAAVTDVTGLDIFTELDFIDINFSGSVFTLSNPKLREVTLQSYGDSIDVNLPQIKKLDIGRFLTLKSANIEAPDLEILKVAGLNEIKFEKFPNLKELKMSSMTLKDADFGALTKLQLLDLRNVKTKTINVSKNQQLETLSVFTQEGEERIKSVETIKLSSSLKHINCWDSALSNLDVSKCKKLETLCVFYGNIKNINLKNAKKLTHLDLSGCKKITKVDVSKNSKLQILRLPYTQIKSINVSKNKKLQILNVSNTRLTSLTLKNNSKLRELQLEDTKIKKLDLKKNTKLKEVDLGKTDIKQINGLKINGITLRFKVKCGKTLDVSKYIGTGWDYDGSSSSGAGDLKYAYNKKKATFQLSKKAKKDDQHEIYLKKGKKKCTICFRVQ